MNKLNFKKTTILFIIQVLFLMSKWNIVFAQDYGYFWPSGYKYVSPVSRDDPLFFKWEKIVGGVGPSPLIDDLMATFPVSKDNWTETYPQCREVTADPRTDGGACSTTGTVTFSYTCRGDVAYQLNSDITAKRLNGGDTMYGAWPMLFSFFAPVTEDSCTKQGRCFVGNAWIIDTKAQKENPIGLYQGFGKKILVEGPGDVFFFDQVRSLTQPRAFVHDTVNAPFLVGDLLPGTTTSVCDPALFDAIPNMPTDVPSQSHSDFDTFVRPKITQELIDAYAGAAEVSGVPCEILAGIHWIEGGMNPTQSLLDGGALRGGTLLTDAIAAANHLQNHMDGYYGHTFDETYEGYTGGLTYYNGTGNRNCNMDSMNCYPGSCVPGAIPTRWRCEGKCPAQWDYEDSPYALSGIDDRHMRMDIIYIHDGNGTCSALAKPPSPMESRQRIGVLTVAILFHNM